jgi:hypothetical protein
MKSHHRRAPGTAGRPGSDCPSTPGDPRVPSVTIPHFLPRVTFLAFNVLDFEKLSKWNHNSCINGVCYRWHQIIPFLYGFV